MKAQRFIGALAILIFSVIGCSPATPDESDRVQGVILPFLSFAPFFIAADEGYFAEENIVFEFVELQQGVQAVPQLLLSNIDVSAGFLDAALLNGIRAGEAAKLVATGVYLDSNGCTYLAAMQNRDNPVVQLEGAKVGLLPNGFLGYYLDRYLNEEGLSPADVEVISLPAPGRVAALAEQSIDLALVGEPQITSMIAATNAEVVQAAESLMNNTDYTFVYFSPRFFSERPDVGQRFLTAYLRGVRQFNEGKTARNIEIIANNTTLEAEQLRSMCWPTFRLDGQVDAASILAFQSWLVEQALITEVVPMSQLHDDRIINAAWSALEE